MIKFALRCSEGHVFESWFQSGTAFEGLQSRGLLTCPVCGDSAIEKALMTPVVAKPTQPASENKREKSPELPEKLQRLRAEIEANSDYVGERFTSEARAMYLGEVPDRPIHGEARPEDAKALIAEGVPVLPLPFIPTRKTN